jgi:chemotaxis signal transduction protein
MQDSLSDTPSQPAQMLAPTEALLRGFELEPVSSGNTTTTQVAVAAAAEEALRGLQLREGFRIGELSLMIRYEKGSELTDLPPTYRLPNAPEWFAGITNLHGTLVPVFDLARYFGVDHSPEAKPMLLVLGHGVDAAGVVIDGLPTRLRFDASDRADDAPVPLAMEGCVNQTYWAGERTWMDLQVDALLNKLNDELAATGQ